MFVANNKYNVTIILYIINRKVTKLQEKSLVFKEAA